jgi:DNA primase
VVGFGGRLLDPEAKDRKYVNSPESPLFHKKEQLYGLHAAMDAIRKTGRAVVVEGNFDVLALHQAGLDEAVAPMGTALTVEQITTLGKLARSVTVVFDGDAAGQRAAQKAVPLFVEADVDGRVARLPAGVDPDDFVRDQAAGGAEAFRRLVEGARPMLDQFIQDSAEDASIPGKMASLERVTELLVRVRNTTKRELYAGQLAGVLGMTTQQVTRALREAAARAQKPSAAQAPAPAAAAPVAPVKLPPEELHLVVLLARYPELISTPEAARAAELLVHPALRRLHRAATTAVAEAGRLDVAAWLDAAPPEVAPTVSAALMDGSLADVAEPAGLLRKLSARLQLQRLEAEMAMNEKQSRQAHVQGDLEALRALSLRGIELRKTKEGLQAALQRP